MGPSGSGKSTLLNIIGGVASPQQGKVILLEHELNSLRASARDRVRADSVGFVFQQFNLVPYLNALDNVLLPCRFSATRRNRVLAESSSQQDVAMRLLGGFFENQPPDFYRAVSGLSVGQQQRVAAARALIGQPRLIIADEPTSALDHETRDGFMRLLIAEAERQGSTLLFVSHDPTLSTRFSRILELRDINRAAG
jgi:putative ABC transport system ATP-binding protein